MSFKSLHSVVRSARRRLTIQLFINNSIVNLILVLAGALVALFLPFSGESRWPILAGVLAGAVLWAALRSLGQAPSALAAALMVDARFQLGERLATAVSLPLETRGTPIGQALLADAASHAQRLRIRERFPVRLLRLSLAIPVLAGSVAVVAFFRPVSPTNTPAVTAAGIAKASPDMPETAAPVNAVPPGRSQAVRDLEARLDTLEQQARDGKTISDVPELAAAQQAEREQFDRLSRSEQALRQLAKLPGDEGPAKALKAALGEGDLPTAERAVTELREKLTEQKFDAGQQARLGEQLARMQAELGKDSRDRVRELARRFREAQQSLQKGDRQQMAADLQHAQEVIHDLRGEVADWQDLRQQIARADRLRKGSHPTEPLVVKPSENAAADTTPVPFDPRGRKVPGGSAPAEGFVRPSPVEAGAAIEQAAQEAATAIEVQRLPREDREAVREYFQRLGRPKK